MAKEKGLIKRIAYSGAKFFRIRTIENDYHSQDGKILKEDLVKDIATTNTGVEFRLFEPNFYDHIHDLNRGPQIPFEKDFGIILAKTGINKDSIVLDSGSGSGYLTCMFASFVKKVYSFDVKEEHLKIATSNAEKLGLKNITFKLLNIYSDVLPIKTQVDLVSLDVPEPWQALENCSKVLKRGGFISVYVPCITQISEFAENVAKRDDFVLIETLEMLERQWIVSGRKVRPENQQIGHTGFICFVRKI
ncbi:methyltransferase domain-containing protein [Candidatus Woesearchaeota archaeon]|nr:methyltransferase domain-containing protein [Candidatus Woesearchaeota archaeon]